MHLLSMKEQSFYPLECYAEKNIKILNFMMSFRLGFFFFIKSEICQICNFWYFYLSENTNTCISSNAESHSKFWKLDARLKIKIDWVSLFLLWSTLSFLPVCIYHCLLLQFRASAIRVHSYSPSLYVRVRLYATQWFFLLRVL